MNKANHRHYDYVFIGTSMICVIEAVYQSLCGKRVLMVDRQDRMGGAWASLDVFGLNNVENAIHYFLPDLHAYDFMEKVLQWDVVVSERKFRVFPLPGGVTWKVPYDRIDGRIATRLKEAFVEGQTCGLATDLAAMVADSWRGTRQPSRYVRGGTPEMLKKVEAILDASEVEVVYGASIESIRATLRADPVEVRTSVGTLSTEKIVVTHGSRLQGLVTPEGPLELEEKLLLRPCVHLLINDASPSNMLECIFSADPLIKYVHDITCVTRQAAELAGRKKLLVLALRHEIKHTDQTFEGLFTKLRRVGMVGKSATVEGRLWQDVYLPRLFDEDLEKLERAYGEQIVCFKTDDFARGIGFHAKRWATKIRVPRRQEHAGATGRLVTQ